MRGPLARMLVMLLGLGASAAGLAQGIDQMDHAHPMVEVPPAYEAPRLQLALFRDTMSGINLHLQLEAFRLEPPEFSDRQSEVLHGHAHLFINGKKVQRLYGPYVHLADALLGPGLNQITVTLNDHEHNTWSRGPHRIFATSFVNLSQAKWQLHHFSSSPLSGAPDAPAGVQKPESTE